MARALIGTPRLILADEPTGNLDESTGEEVAQLLFQLTAEEDVGLVLVTHDKKLLARAGRCLHLEAGGLSSL